MTSAIGDRPPLRTLSVQGQSVTLTEPQIKATMKPLLIVPTGKDGVLSLTSAVGGKSPLRTLSVQGQNVTLTEPQMIATM